MQRQWPLHRSSKYDENNDNAGERSDQRKRIEGIPRAILRTVFQNRVIGEEDGIEFPALGDFRKISVVVDVGDGLNPGLGQAPRGFVLADVSEKGIEMKLTGLGHAWPPS